jgi:hypothetical protein
MIKAKYELIKLDYRDLLCRISFLLILISLLYSFFSHTLLSQLKSPVLIFPSTDLTYWVFHILKIPEFIVGHSVIALLFDIMLFTSCVACLYYPSRRFWIKLFFIFYFIYFIIFNSYGNHHTHSKIGVLLLPIPFMMADNTGFYLLWKGLRYYTCFIFASAFLWKLFRGSWLIANQGMLIMKRNMAPYLYYNPNSLLAEIYYFFFRHPWMADTIMKTGFLMEGLFLVGFFTFRFDKYLFILSILLPIGFLFVADALFFELAFLSIVFYNNQNFDSFRQPLRVISK